MATGHFASQHAAGAKPARADELGLRRHHFVGWAAHTWRELCTLYQVLLLVRFSLLLGVIGGLVLVLNDQAQDVVRALGEDPDRRIVWLIATTVASAGVAWWSARVMFYFRFHNPASAPTVCPRVKEHLPRAIGASALVLVAIALVTAGSSYDSLFAGPALWLFGLALLFLVLAAVFVYLAAKRRDWFRLYGPRPEGLRSLRELHWQAWLPLALAGAAGFALMIVFAYQAVWLAHKIGTAAVGLAAMLGLIPLGTLLVYGGNRARLPVVTLVLVWAAISSWVADNHYVRLSAGSDSYPPPEDTHAPLEAAAAAPVAAVAPAPDPGVAFRAWLEGLQPAADGKIQVIIVAAEGGGIRAAYWTALVLGELQDEAAAAGLDFARHVFAISGVSGGSLGAATFAALVANRGVAPNATGDCPVDGGGERSSVRLRAEGVLDHDFLSPTVAVMLFPDLFQQFVPYAFLNDRAVAIEHAFEAAWDGCEQNEWLSRRYDALWTSGVTGVPLLFLNSTVVETGQRLIAAPIRIEEPTFSEALDGREVVGRTIPLSTAVHDSARFTYVSPAGTVRWRDHPERWLRLVDGGYFENSGAVTAAEILRLVRTENDRLREDDQSRPEIRPVVIHISNDPEVTDATDLEERRKVLNQVVAPVKTLLHVRSGRGFQAREDLEARVGPQWHVHFRLCRKPDQVGPAAAQRAPLPLGWALSKLARAEMRRQLGLAGAGADDGISARNRANLQAVLKLLRGQPVDDEQDRWGCPNTTPLTADNDQGSAARVAQAPR